MHCHPPAQAAFNKPAILRVPADLLKLMQQACLHAYNRAPMSKSNKAKSGSGSAQIVANRKAGHEYHLEERFEAGLVLEGWEVKSLRAGRCNLTEAYIFLKDGEAFMSGCRIEPLATVSTHITPNPVRIRKLLLHQREIAKLFAGTQKQGMTCVALNMHWVRGRAKLELALAKGKQLHDKRASEKDRDWKREKQRLLRRD